MRTGGIGRVIAALVSLGGSAWAQSSGKVDSGDDGVEVVLVTLGDKRALVRVTGSGSELDNRVRLHEIEDGGRGRVDYRGLPAWA
jgi:hypothetical protein